MERLTGKGAKSLKEAYAKVYDRTEVEQLDEQGGTRGAFRQKDQQRRERARIEADRRVQAAGGGAAAEKEELERLKKGNVKPSGSGSQRWRPKTEDQLTTQARYNVRQQGQQNLEKNPDFQAPEKTVKTEPKTPPKTPLKTPPASSSGVLALKGGVQGRLNKATGKFTAGNFSDAEKARYTAAGGKIPSAKPVPSTNSGGSKAVATGTTSGGTKFERRTPTSAELRAAQVARAAGKGSEGQVKAAVQQGQRQASVNAAIKSANRPEVLNKQAPAGSALRAQQDRLAQKNSVQREVAAVKSGMPANTQSSVNNTVKSAVPTGNTIKTTVNPDSSMRVTQKRTPAATAEIKKSLQLSSVDLFDIVKGHLIDEHELSEDVAIKLMSILDEETRGDIMEYTAAIRADAAPKGTTMKMTAGGKEPPGDRLLRGIKDRVGGFLRNLNPEAMKSTNVEPRKPLVSTQKNSKKGGY